MAVKQYKPTSPGRRGMLGRDFSALTKKEPEKSLLVSFTRRKGRDNKGHISVRHRGGGSKRRYRIVDFKRDKVNVPGKIVAIEYDPNRSAFLALVNYKDGEKRYILAYENAKVGDLILSGETAPIKEGNALPLAKIPVGTYVHNIELTPGKGGQLCRSAGSFAQIMGIESRGVILKLPSGEMRIVSEKCWATIGQVGNAEHEVIHYGKAGRVRHMGRRPRVRGIAMNAVDHPHGGGEGRAKPGHQLTTPWGKPTKGYRTRKNKRTRSFILKRRKK